MMDRNKPLISIVVPVFNRAEIVGDTLASLASQTLRPLEVILVDNASTDATAEVLRHWQAGQASSGIDVAVTTCTIPGAAAARNAGLARARGEWIMFFDSDDIMPAGHAAFAAAAIEAHPTADIIGWDCTTVEVDGRRNRARFGSSKLQWNNLFRGYMATQRWCARRTLLEAVGGWRQDMRYWDDIELGARLLARAGEVVYAGRSGVEVRQRLRSITGDYSSAPISRIDAPLAAIADTLRPIIGERADRWVDLKRAIEYGVMARAGSPAAVAAATHLHTIPQRLAYTMTRHSIPAAAYLLSPFLG